MSGPVALFRVLPTPRIKCHLSVPPAVPTSDGGFDSRLDLLIDGRPQVDVDLAYGDDVVCTFFNGELPPANLTVVKEDEPATWDPEFAFNAAGIDGSNPVMTADCPLDQWSRVLAVNLTGCLLTAQAFGRGMLERGRGALVHVAHE